MKIVIDIGHPAHVHYFRNFIMQMKSKGHEFLVFARDKEVSFSLLDHYNIPYVSRLKGNKSLFGKMIYLVQTSWFIFKQSRKFKPDFFLSFASPYLVVSKCLLKKPYIVFDDTEHARFEQKFFIPFSNAIFTPKSFFNQLNRNHFRFDGFMELAYLHKDIYIPDPKIKTKLGVADNEKYVLIRFVSWEAVHDIGESGLSFSAKKQLISSLSEHMKVFISSEKELPEEFRKYQIKINPEDMHHAIFFAYLYIGEGATMATEACQLGVPAIYVNSLNAGTLQEQKDAGIMFHFINGDGVLEKAMQIITDPDHHNSIALKCRQLSSSKTNITNVLMEIFEHYPSSLHDYPYSSD